MITVAERAERYFKKLIADQDMPGLGLRMTVVRPGSPTADCELTFCPKEDAEDTDHVSQFDGFDVYVDTVSAPYLADAVVEFEDSPTGGQINVSAPQLRAAKPTDDAPFSERVTYVLNSEVNPSVAGHGGHVSLVEVSEANDVVLEFGGGCHGCSMVDVTLKDGVEKTLRERLPDIGTIQDVTDHAKGDNPFYT